MKARIRTAVQVQLQRYSTAKGIWLDRREEVNQQDCSCMRASVHLAFSHCP